MNVADLVEYVAPCAVRWRRHMHENPELSFQEHETARFVRDVLGQIGELEVSSPTPTSVMATLRGGAGAGRLIALRADIDALPIHEESEHPFRSRVAGRMHACGHDGHTAMLLATAHALARVRDDLRGEIRFLFQHAEELPPGGAVDMIEAGVLDGVEEVVGCHLLTTMPTGVIAVPEGHCTASADNFEITIRGHGTHAAWPHLGTDPVPIAAQVVTALQQVVARRTSPHDSLVLSVTRIHGGLVDNVIPETVVLGGTVRAFRPQVREATEQEIRRIVTGIAGAHGATADVQITRGYPSCDNHPGVAQRVGAAVRQVPGAELVEMEPLPAGDDMAYFVDEVPGVYFFVGTSSPEADSTYPHHHPRFTIDEASLPLGIGTYLHYVLGELGT
jgi:amidohydrolase